MTPEQQQQFNEMQVLIENLKSSSTIPKEFDSAIRERLAQVSKMTSITLASGATNISIASDTMQVTGDSAGNGITTITGGVPGQIITLLFIDTKVTLVEDATTTQDTINLSGVANFVSTANDVVRLLYAPVTTNDAYKWFEVSRSVN